MTAEVYLSTTDLALARGDTSICQGLSMQLRAGECIHLHGPNGSGKTSLLQALCGLLRPEAGSVQWHVGSPHASLHYCAHQNALKSAWTIAENLGWHLRLHGYPVREDDWEEALAAMRLSHLSDTPAAQLSQGEKRRAALMRLAVMPRPVWLLDEPFNALDSAAQECLAQWVNHHVRQGGAVLFSSHSGHPSSLQLSRRVSMEVEGHV
ncbi:heme ABC exporter ATP-binding protein CcmA [Achromobacter sp. F4_2707]|uniref:heme ABC exporter ATP-binding protein CcmA n=1 Tax=Achromobacter sp. F4_2707 TaxID=3114286 RepID=UPI0039C6D6A4